MVKHMNNTRPRRSRRWSGVGILKLFAGVILGIVCLPLICFIVANEKAQGKDPSYRRERRERRRNGSNNLT